MTGTVHHIMLSYTLCVHHQSLQDISLSSVKSPAPAFFFLWQTGKTSVLTFWLCLHSSVRFYSEISSKNHRNCSFIISVLLKRRNPQVCLDPPSHLIDIQHKKKKKKSNQMTKTLMNTTRTFTYPETVTN